ncbi:hypothetical protein KJ567_07380 [Candidatus Bipolaricaulota bacterium]|nr:hypothetical protein [Candidatus Bipolaricaulota bacterium]
MGEAHEFLAHYLGAIAYRAQKALRGAPADFGGFRMTSGVRTPAELVRHMTSVLGYARTFFVGGTYRPEPLPTLGAEISRFHEMLESLSEQIEHGAFERITPLQLLQGPLSDVMSHVGQLALLRRLAGSPVPPENFIFAAVSADNLGAKQPDPVAPDEEWTTPEDDPRGEPVADRA